MGKLSIKVTSNAKTLSSYSGLHLFSDLISKFDLKASVGPFLPEKARKRGFRAFRSFAQGFWDLLLGPNAWMISTGWAKILYLKSSLVHHPR